MYVNYTSVKYSHRLKRLDVTNIFPINFPKVCYYLLLPFGAFNYLKRATVLGKKHHCEGETNSPLFPVVDLFKEKVLLLCFNCDACVYVCVYAIRESL